MKPLSKECENQLIDLLKSVYTTQDDLMVFVGRYLDKNLEDISNSKARLETIVVRLVEDSICQGYIKKLIEKFSEKTPERKDIQLFCAQVLRNDLIEPNEKITKERWSSLFAYLHNKDVLELRRAFTKAYFNVFGIEYSEARPGEPIPNEITEFQSLVEKFSVSEYAPTLAVRVAEFLVKEIQKSIADSDKSMLSEIERLEQLNNNLQTWGNEISHEFSVSRLQLKSPMKIIPKGHLLVSLKEHGDQLIAYPELYLVIEEKTDRLKSFAEEPTAPCSLDEVLGYISKWILIAEEKVFEKDEQAAGQIVVELFLPIRYLSHDVSSWILQDEDDDDVCFGSHRPFIVRSVYRAISKRCKIIQSQIEKKWPTLVDGSGKYYIDYFEQGFSKKGRLPGELNKDGVIGMQLVFKEVLDEEDQSTLLKDIRKSPSLITLWGVESSHGKKDILQSKFEDLVEADWTCGFSSLAEKYRDLYNESTDLVKNMRVLCECPHRWPKTLPDTANEAQKFVA